eukprot:7057739-Lingulodinium_polyedra.AAC.1
MVVSTRQEVLVLRPPQGQGASKSGLREGVDRGVPQLARLAYVAQRQGRGAASVSAFAPRQTVFGVRAERFVAAVRRVSALEPGK